MMAQRMGMIGFVLVFLLIEGSLAWSQRHQKPIDTSAEIRKLPKDAETTSEEFHSPEDPIESKLREHYAPEPRGHHYILEEDYNPHDHQSGKDSEEYIDSEDNKSHKESEELQAHHDSDDSKKDDEFKEYLEKGNHEEFEQGGASFDNHAKDHKIDNKEVENIKQHDVGAKFGGEAVKEHKLGKKRDKSKGHKSHGFKNVYHKEEYGDHKTFHDEFLDKDTLHDYDDHHEHKEMSGGKFSKGLKHEGKNKSFDKGDEKHQWGKSGYDGHQDGKHEKGGHSSKHRHGTKKRQGHHQADVLNNKHSVHKIKKGNPPIYSPHVGHHGPHQAQIQPYIPHHHSHGSHKGHAYNNHHHQPQLHQELVKDDEHHGQDVYHNNQEDNYNYHGDHGSDYDHDVDHRNNHGGPHHHHHHHKKEQHFPEQHEIEAEERVQAKHETRHPFNEQLDDRSADRIAQKHESVQFRQPVPENFHKGYHREPLSHKQQFQHRQPAYEGRNRKQHFDDQYQRRYHRIRFGEQEPRNHHHHSHHHPHHHPQQHQMSESARNFNGHHMHGAPTKHQGYPRSYDQPTEVPSLHERNGEQFSQQIALNESPSILHRRQN